MVALRLNEEEEENEEYQVMTKIGHQRVEPNASDISCVPSRHQHDKERRNEVQGQDEPSQRDHMLEACHPYGDHGYVKI